MAYEFTFFSIIFQSNYDDVRVIMKDYYVQSSGNLFTIWSGRVGRWL